MEKHIRIIDRYSDEEFKEIVKVSHSITEVIRKLGYKKGSGIRKEVAKKIEILNIELLPKGKPTKRTPNNVFVKNSTASQQTLRRYYLKGNYSKYECSICGQLPEWNGKEMTLILDHIDGDCKNDVLENLRWVCPNCNSQLETTGTKNPIFKNKHIKKRYYCIDCGKELVDYRSKRCQECSSKNVGIIKRQYEIERNELKTLIRTKSFAEIGRMNNVSDNSIKRRCKTYNLPYRKIDINKYSDEEWEKI